MTWNTTFCLDLWVDLNLWPLVIRSDYPKAWWYQMQYKCHQQYPRGTVITVARPICESRVKKKTVIKCKVNFFWCWVITLSWPCIVLNKVCVSTRVCPCVSGHSVRNGTHKEAVMNSQVISKNSHITECMPWPLTISEQCLL